MSAPVFNILTTHELTIDLSRPAMERIVAQLAATQDWAGPLQVQVEVANFQNMLYNLLERSKPEPENLDLIGA